MAQSTRPDDKRANNKGNFGKAGNQVRHPWNEARILYVQGEKSDDGTIEYPTMVEVGERLNIPVQQIRVRAAEEKWSRQRIGAEEAAYKTALARTIEDRAAAIEQFDGVCRTLAEEALQIILDKLEAAEDLDEKYQIIKSVSRQVMEYQKVGRIALGVATDIRQNMNTNDEGPQEKGPDIETIKDDLRMSLVDMPLAEIRRQLGL